MSWISGVVTGVKAIFGSSQDGASNVMTVAKGIGSFIDEQQYTKQEIAANNKEMIPLFQKFMENTIDENTERSRTRRDIALWIIRSWIIMLWMCVVAYGIELIINATEHEFSAFVFQIATIDAMIYLVLGVGGFFFGAHIIRQVKG